MKDHSHWNNYHGKSKIPEYQVWLDMRHRCLSSKSRLYKDYGGRGIRVCPRWQFFENFLEDMGSRPGSKREYTLERINNDKGYSPSNCKWATWKEQGQNRRPRKSSPKGEENGQSKLTQKQVQYIRDTFKPNQDTLSFHSAKSLAQKLGVAYSTVYRIINQQYWKEV